MAKAFHCSIVTPTETVYDGEVEYASFPASDGQHGVIAGQSPVLSRLGYGSLRLDFAEGGSRWYLLEGGVAQVQDGELTLLTSRATAAERLSVETAEVVSQPRKFAGGHGLLGRGSAERIRQGAE